RARGNRSLQGMGTTMTATYLDGDEVHLAQVGDSRAYLLRDGLRQITTDHTLVHEMVERGQITAEEAEHHPQRSILTRALGVDEPVDVEEFTVEVRVGDRLLLRSDGLHSMVTAEAIAGTRRDAGGTPPPGLSAPPPAPEMPPSGNGATATAPPPPEMPEQMAAEAALAPPAARHAAEPRRRRRRGRRVVVAVVALVAVLAAAFVGLRLYLDTRWFVGVQGGRVALFRGVPTTILGQNLYGMVETTNIAAQ